jgi:L-rhamnose isomerase/sugar isomerase
MRITSERISGVEESILGSHESAFGRLEADLASRGVDVPAVMAALQSLSIGAPSWALGTGGTRFGRFPGGGEPRSLEEKVDDVAALNALTTANRTISLHIPWDDPRDPKAIREHAASVGLGFDAMNSNTFQDNEATTRGKFSFKHGSLANPDPAVRQRAIDHNLEVIELGKELGSHALTCWLGDGSNHPGQVNFVRQFERVASGLAEIHDHLPPGWLMFTEHKPYEPAFYSSVNNDWGTSLMLAQAAGQHARCLVDLGHHLQGANIEQVVSRLGMAGRLGGFHFNDSKYGDDDLTVGSINPYQLFLIMLELLDLGGGSMPPLAYMIDASHNVKDPIEDLIQSTEEIQQSVAHALLVDRQALTDAQDATDAAGAAEILQDAYRTDVRPLVAEVRRRQGGALRPLPAFRALGYRHAMIEARGSSTIATGL